MSERRTRGVVGGAGRCGRAGDERRGGGTGHRGRRSPRAGQEANRCVTGQAGGGPAFPGRHAAEPHRALRARRPPSPARRGPRGRPVRRARPGRPAPRGPPERLAPQGPKGRPEARYRRRLRAGRQRWHSADQPQQERRAGQCREEHHGRWALLHQEPHGSVPERAGDGSGRLRWRPDRRHRHHLRPAGGRRCVLGRLHREHRRHRRHVRREHRRPRGPALLPLDRGLRTRCIAPRR